MRHPFNPTIIAALFAVLVPLISVGSAPAMEKTGDLVFNAVQKMGQHQTSYLGEINQVKQHREVVRDKVAQIKDEILSLPPGTPAVRRKHLEAEFSKNLALNIKGVSKELEITGKYAAEHAKTLYALLDSLEKEGGALNEKTVNEILNRSRPVLQNSRDLYLSLAQHQNAITDPVVLNKLQHANHLARTWDDYINLMQKNNSGNQSSRKQLVVRVRELLEQFNSIACETDLLTAIVAEESATLQLVNQIATYELVYNAFSGGSEFAGDMAKNTLGPIREDMENIRGDIRFVSDSVSRPIRSSGPAAGSGPNFPQSWGGGGHNF